MTSKFETTLRRVADRETLRRGKMLLASGAVAGCFPRSGSTELLCLVESKDGKLLSLPIERPLSRNLREDGRLTPEIVAALLHCARHLSHDHHNHKGEEPAPVPAVAPPVMPAHSNLRPVRHVIEEAAAAPVEAYLQLTCERPPHAASTWEKFVFSATITHAGRVYACNQQKIKQMRFEGGLPGRPSLSMFSLQDRQIIRFLSQKSESDGTVFSLMAEDLSEFMHCLVGFPRLLHGNRPIVPHRNPAEPVLIEAANGGGECCPGILVEAGAVPLRNPHIILGKCGAWVGVIDDYWWVPATVDILWLRNFLLSQPSAELAKSFAKPDSPTPVKAVSGGQTKLKKRKCVPRYIIEFTKHDELALHLEFNYSGGKPHSRHSGLLHDGTEFWIRDTEAETEVLDELRLAGFVPSGSGEELLFKLKDVEAIGLFFDKTLPSWRENPKNAFYSENLLSLAADGVPVIELTCFDPSLAGETWELAHTLTAGGRGGISWRDVQRTRSEGRSYLRLVDGGIGRISELFGEFLRRVGWIVRPSNSSPDRLALPRGAVPYWIESAKELPAAVPPEWRGDKILAAEREHATIPADLALFTGDLRGYQLAAVEWMLKMTAAGYNVVLADEMGLGKTVQALAAIASRKKTGFTAPTMVVCPTSLVENWEAEATRFASGLRRLVVSGSNREEQLKDAMSNDLVITSYALVKRDAELYEDLNFGLLILDEAQHIKNPGTANARVCKSIHSDSRVVLTGTPLENSPEDLWSIFDFLNPGMLGSLGAFKERYGGADADAVSRRELATIVAPFIMRRQKSEIDEQLPTKTEQVLYCEMLPSQRLLYDRLLEEGRSRCASFIKGKGSRFDVLTALLRLRQLCCHPSLVPEQLRGGSVCESAKTELLKEVLLEAMDSGHRTLVFSQFTSLLAVLRGWLDDESVVYEYLDGQTKNRLERVNKFNKDENISVFLLSLKAGGVGLHLTGADTVIIYDPWWNPSVEAQAADRTHRIGQTRPVTALKLVLRNSIEEKILDLQKRKQRMFNEIMPASSYFKGLSDSDLEYLLA